MDVMTETSVIKKNSESGDAENEETLKPEEVGKSKEASKHQTHVLQDGAVHFRWVVCNLGLLQKGGILRSPIFWNGDPFKGVQTMRGWRLELRPWLEESNDDKEWISVSLQLVSPSPNSEVLPLRFRLVAWDEARNLLADYDTQVDFNTKGGTSVEVPRFATRDMLGVKVKKSLLDMCEMEEESVVFTCTLAMLNLPSAENQKEKPGYDVPLWEGLSELARALTWERAAGTDIIATHLLALARDIGLGNLERACHREIVRNLLGQPCSTCSYVTPDSSSATEGQNKAQVPLFACHVQKAKSGLHSMWERVKTHSIKKDNKEFVDPLELLQRGEGFPIRATQSDPELCIPEFPSACCQQCEDGIHLEVPTK